MEMKKKNYGKKGRKKKQTVRLMYMECRKRKD